MMVCNVRAYVLDGRNEAWRRIEKGGGRSLGEGGGMPKLYVQSMRWYCAAKDKVP